MNVTGRLPGWYLTALLIGWGLLTVAGCSKSGEVLAPVAGKATVDGKPLKSGTVSFRPDASKGNGTAHWPNGAVDAEGNFELTVPPGRKGAPPGWYKVVVIALDDPWPGKPHKWLANQKYSDESTTPLRIEVVPNPEPGRYDLKLTK
jgi:hypothetical protein